MTTYRGTLVSFNSGTFLASVRLTGSGAQAMASLPVSRAIPAAEMVNGRIVVGHAIWAGLCSYPQPFGQMRGAKGQKMAATG